jgi:hypothetical protein
MAKYDDYEIQVGRDRSAYQTKYSTTNAAQAEMLYRGLNIGNGYKKRLKKNGKIIARFISQP